MPQPYAALREPGESLCTRESPRPDTARVALLFASLNSLSSSPCHPVALARTRDKKLFIG